MRIIGAELFRRIDFVMNVRPAPGSALYFQDHSIQCWSSAQKKFLVVSTEEARVWVGGDGTHPNCARLLELGLWVQDEGQESYPPYKHRGHRPLIARVQGTENLAPMLYTSTETCLRFHQGTLIAWSPGYQVKRTKKRWGRYVELSVEATELLIACANGAAVNGVAQDEVKQHWINALKEEGLLVFSPSKPMQVRKKIAWRMETTSVLPRIAEEPSLPSPSPLFHWEQRVDIAFNKLFLYLVYGLIFIPCGFLLRLSPSFRKQQKRGLKSTWTSMRTKGLERPASYEEPF
jgi:hypothetical protein